MTHGWRAAVDQAHGQATRTARRQRVTWDRVRLLWVVTEVDLTPSPALCR